MALVSIGIPFLNPGPVFEMAVKSVFAQTFDDWELILVDDGSDDGSLEWAGRICDPRVRLLSDGKTRALNFRLNQIAGLAQTPYLFRMDADDVMHPKRIERQYAALCKAGNDTVIGTASYAMDANGRVLGYRPVPASTPRGFGVRRAVQHVTVAATTAWFRNNPYSSDSMFFRSEDAELWCRTNQNTRFVNLDEPMFYIREVGTGTFKKYSYSILGGVGILAKYYERPRMRFMWDLTKELAKLWIYGALWSYGKADLLERRRSRRLTPAETALANDGMAIVSRQVLPMREDLPSLK